jgi:6-phosphogluconolactonase
MFDVESAPTPPVLPGTVILRPTPEDVNDAIASDILSQALACIREFGDFHIALSGGSTPLPLYRLMMFDTVFRHLPWKKTHLWIVDERCVPFDDERSNFKQIKEIIVDHADIPKSQVHPMEATLPDAAERYEARLREVLEWREKGHDRLDFVLLGMGSDAHTASLFPHSKALKDRSYPPRMVLGNDGPEVTPPNRVTMTAHLLNAARCLGVMVVGQSKAATLAKVSAAYRAAGHEPYENLPILSIQPKAGELRWYMDHAACQPAPAKS